MNTILITCIYIWLIALQTLSWDLNFLFIYNNPLSLAFELDH